MKPLLDPISAADRSRLARRVTRLEADGGVRLEMEIGSVDLLPWFSRQKTAARLYWADRSGQQEIAAIGLAEQHIARAGDDPFGPLAIIGGRLAELPEHTRFYGGMAFDPYDDRNRHEPLGILRFLVPQVEIGRDGTRYTLAVNHPYPASSSAESESEREAAMLALLSHHEQQLRTNEASEPRDDHPNGLNATILEQAELPDPNGWERMVRRAIEQIQTTDLGKVVLSRRRELILAEPLEAHRLLKRLISLGNRAYQFCFDFGGHIFLGSTPECLYHRQGRKITTEAIAGTCAVCPTQSDTDDRLASMLASSKEASEHRYVYDQLRAQLDLICEHQEVLSQREVLRLRHVQHLMSRLAGDLRPDVGTADILSALHPTAAVGGFPREAAIQQIRQLEPHGRGWYAGPVGWMSRDSDVFAVGIRSCRIDGCRLTLPAGAGIVSASEPAAEWAETEVKMRQFLDALA